MVGGGDPFYVKSTGPRWSKITDFEPIIARSASAVTSGEKSSINTNRKSTTHFPRSVRWSSYVAPKSPVPSSELVRIGQLRLLTKQTMYNLTVRVMSRSNFSTVDNANCSEFWSRSLNCTNSCTYKVKRLNKPLHRRKSHYSTHHRPQHKPTACKNKKNTQKKQRQYNSVVTFGNEPYLYDEMR